MGQQKKSDSRGSERVMCLHGYQDNCASFDRLIPMLDGDRTYLCFDWPNHGGSSGTPLGARWTMENYAVTIRRVADHVQWSAPFGCLGHSMGGQVAKLFAAVYPECVAWLVLLDTAGPVAACPEEITWSMRRAGDELLRLENKMSTSTSGGDRPPPVYGYPGALERVRRRHYGQLDDEPARTLMTRYLRPGPTGEFHLANDVRLGVPYSQWFSPAQHRDVVTNVRCPTLLIRASDSDSYYIDVYGVFVEMYEENPNFRTVGVDGNHDVHMNNPRAVATLINKFLNNKLSKL